MNLMTTTMISAKRRPNYDTQVRRAKKFQLEKNHIIDALYRSSLSIEEATAIEVLVCNLVSHFLEDAFPGINMPVKTVQIFTDGGTHRSNPGPGGYGTIVRVGDTYEREYSDGFRRTTNNRMELMAAIVGLRSLRSDVALDVTLYSDSQYLVNGHMKGWAQRWQKNGWRNGRKPVLNADLWKDVLHYTSAHRVTMIWVRGHNGHVENERCDALAAEASRSHAKQIDEGYETEKILPSLFP